MRQTWRSPRRSSCSCSCSASSSRSAHRPSARWPSPARSTRASCRPSSPGRSGAARCCSASGWAWPACSARTPRSCPACRSRSCTGPAASCAPDPAAAAALVFAEGVVLLTLVLLLSTRLSALAAGVIGIALFGLAWLAGVGRHPGHGVQHPCPAHGERGQPVPAANRRAVARRDLLPRAVVVRHPAARRIARGRRATRSSPWPRRPGSTWPGRASGWCSSWCSAWSASTAVNCSRLMELTALC